MAAPTPTARQTPTNFPLKDGFSSKVTLASNPTINFWEKGVQAPGIDGGEPIEQTTMFNTAWRTMRSRSLKTLTTHTITAAFDPAVLTDAVAAVNKEDTITVSFSDGATIAFYGYLQKIEIQEMTEGAQPQATVTIVPTNFDPTNHVEAGPVVAAVPGT
jgi:hypothetical protein